MSLSAEELRKAALNFPGSFEDFPFGPEPSVFKVKAPGGAQRPAKVFAISSLEELELTISLKCDPLLAPQLRAANPGIIPGYHLNKQHWNTVDVLIVEAGMALDMLEDSYDLVVAGLSKKEQIALEWRALLEKECWLSI